MDLGGYKWHRRAYGSYLNMETDERARVMERLKILATIPVEQWPAVWATLVPGDPGLYLVKIDDSLRVFLQTKADEPSEVMDFVHQGTLDLFRKQPASQAP